MSITLPEMPPTDPGHSQFPEANIVYEKLWSLATNLWWSWHPECDQLFREIDPIR